MKSMSFILRFLAVILCIITAIPITSCDKEEEIPGPPVLLAYYPFNGGANDASGNGHHGIVEGASLTSDRFGYPNRAYYFDGSNDRITTTFIPTRINSISVWFNAESPQPFNAGVFSTYNGGNFNGYYLGFQQSDPKGALYYDGNRLEPIIFPGWNQWTHLVVCSDGTQITVYVNGIHHVTFAGGTTHAGNLYIGDSKYNAHYFKGVIDDIRIYDKPLSASEVQNLYLEGGW